MLVRNPMTHDSRVEKEAHSLADAGYDVTVVAEAEGGLPRLEERDGYHIHRVARPRTRARGLRMIVHLRRLEEYLVALAPEILHAHDSDALSPVGRAARRLTIPFVLDAHELWLGRRPRGRGRLYGALSHAYYVGVQSRYVPRAAAWITVSPVIARHLRERYHINPVELIPNYPELEPLRRLDLRGLPGGGESRSARGWCFTSAPPCRGVVLNNWSMRWP